MSVFRYSRFRLSALVLAIALSLAVVGVAYGSSSRRSGHKSASHYTVAGSREDQDPSQILMDTTFDAQAKAYGWKTLPAVSADFSSSTQLTDVQNLIHGGAQGLVIDPTDPHAIIPALKFAKSQKVPVVTIDDVNEGGPVYMMVTVDNLLMGEEACEATGKALHGKGVTIALEGSQLTSSGILRQAGYTNCMKKNFPGIQVVQEETVWSASTASSQLQTALTAYPNANSIYMASDTAFLAAVLAVLQRDHKTATAGQPGHIFLSSIDGTPQALAALRKGEMDVVVSQPITSYGSYAAEYLKDAFAGKKLHTGHGLGGGTVVKFHGNLEDLLPSTVVTKKNVNSKSLWGNRVKS